MFYSIEGYNYNFDTNDIQGTILFNVNEYNDVSTISGIDNINMQSSALSNQIIDYFNPNNLKNLINFLIKIFKYKWRFLFK